jgi:hypothetical protein
VPRRRAGFDVIAGSTVAASFGDKASTRAPRAKVVNNADAADIVAAGVPERAFAADAADMRVYTERKLREAAKKHSGRKKF